MGRIVQVHVLYLCSYLDYLLSNGAEGQQEILRKTGGRSGQVLGGNLMGFIIVAGDFDLICGQARLGQSNQKIKKDGSGMKWERIRRIGRRGSRRRK